jgi:integrase
VPRKLERNPFNYYSWPKGKHKKKEAWTRQEVEKLAALSLMEYSPIWNARNIWLFSLQAHGMRISDLLQLRCENIREGRLCYFMQKSGNAKRPKLTPKAIEILIFYGYGRKEQGYIFPFLHEAFSRHPDEIKVKVLESKTTSINKYLKKLAAMAEVDKDISTHAARNSVAFELRKRDTGIGKISGILGHSSERTTEHYMTELEDEDFDKATEDLF